MKYRLLNIFYNREAEIEILKKTWAKEEDEQIKRKRPGKKYKEWLKKNYKEILQQISLPTKKLERRHQTPNLEQKKPLF